MISILKSKKNSNDLEKCSKIEKNTWINLVKPSEEEIIKVADALKIETNIISQVLVEKELPRVKRLDNATLIGNKTYGKGVIQTLYPLSDNSGLKITTDEYFTPNHNKINKVGVEPDIKIDDYLYTGELDLENDTQLKRAIEELTK